MTISRGQAVGTFLTVCLFALVFSMVPPFSDWVAASANNIYPYPGNDIQFDYFVGGLAGLLCGVAIIAGPFHHALRPTILFCWAMKLATALFIMPIYEFAYGFDIDGYFMIYDAPPAAGIVFGNGTSNIRLIAWWLFQVIGPNFHGGKVLFTFIGFLGIYLTYRGAVMFLKSENPFLLVLMTLSPTGIFWSSLLGKDPIVLFGVGLYAYGSFGWLSQASKRHLALAALGAVIAAFIRVYFLPILTVPLALAFFVQTRRPIVRALLLPFILAGAHFSVTSFQKDIKVDSFDAFSAYQANIATNWKGGSGFALPTVDTPVMLVAVAPLGAFTALFRPMIFEAHNPFALAAALDNTFLLILAIYAFARSRLREFAQPEILWMSIFVLLWSTMYGLGSGNMGAISRFKIQVLPTFITLLVYMARKRMQQPESVLAKKHA